MRFNSVEHITTYLETGKFPEIHDGVYDLYLKYHKTGNVLDLCCGLGLLTERINKHGEHKCFGIEKSKSMVYDATLAGLENIFSGDALDIVMLANFIRVHNINTIICRRCMPELFSSQIDKGYIFSEMLSRQGVENVIIQGRNVSVRTKNRLGSVDDEIELFVANYKLKFKDGQFAVMSKSC